MSSTKYRLREVLLEKALELPYLKITQKKQQFLKRKTDIVKMKSKWIFIAARYTYIL